MDTQQNEQIRAYREELLTAIRGQADRRHSAGRRQRAGRRHEDQPESFQVFVDQDSVGTLDGSRDETSRLSIRRERPIHTIEVRSESGVLIGGLCARESDRKTAQFHAGRSVLHVSVHNRPDGGSVHVALQAASPAWSQVLNLLAEAAAAVARIGTGWSSFRSPLLAGIQVVLMVAVLFLVAERIIDRGTHDPSLQADSSAPPMAQQEQLLRQLARTQEETIQAIKAQQQTVAGLQQVVGTVVQTQHTLGGNVRDLQRMSNHIVQLTELQERITREQEKLQHDITLLKNHELRSSLEQQAVAVAKMLEANKSAGVEPKQAAQATESKHEPTAYLVTFWVSFQDGTSEESIEKLVRDIHGRKGPSNAGWYPVEVNLPKRQASDELIESLKKTKIVKAVTTSLNTSSPPK